MCFKNMMYGPEVAMPSGQPGLGYGTTPQQQQQQSPVYNNGPAVEQQQYAGSPVDYYHQQQQQLNNDVMQELEEVLFEDCVVDSGSVLPPPPQAYQPQYLDEHRTSPMSVSSDCTSPNDVNGVCRTRYHHHRRAQPYKRFGDRAVFAGHARPPEYQPYMSNGYHLPPNYFYSQNVIDNLGQEQYSPGQDVDIKQFAVSPATSLDLAGGQLHSQSMCKVCGDTASGNHFGVLSCEACKSFFRRSIRSSARYACRASRGCTIEKHTRNRCQYCRLQKCMQMGMRKEAVQEERAPPVTKTPLRAGTPTQLQGFSSAGTNFPSVIATSLQPQPSLHPSLRSLDGPMSPIVSNLMHSRMFGSLPNMKMGIDQDKLTSINSSISMMLPPDSDSRPVTPVNSDMYSMGGMSNQLSASVLVDADVQTDVPLENIQTKEGVKLDDVFEGARQSLLGIIEWSKRIPAFTSLSLDDQVKLLKTSWCQHVLLKLATRIGPRSDTVLLSSGVTCRKDQIEDPEIRRIVDHLSNEISYWLDVLHVDRVELACIKGIILFDPDARGLSSGSRKRVEIFQEQILTALESRCRTVYPVTPLRFSKLLLRLPPLKTAALEATQHMEVQRTLGNAKIDNIFGELLDFD